MKLADNEIRDIIKHLEAGKSLPENGSIYVHCDWRVNSYLRLILDEIFGKDKLRNEIIWTYSGGAIPKIDFPRKHDTIFKYLKTDVHIFNTQYKPYNELTARRMKTIHKGVMVDLERGGLHPL